MELVLPQMALKTMKIHLEGLEDYEVDVGDTISDDEDPFAD